MRRTYPYLLAAFAAGVNAHTAWAQQAPNAPPAPGAPQSPATPANPNAPSTPAVPGTALGTTPGPNTATTTSGTTAPQTDLPNGGSITRNVANPSPVYDVNRTIREAIDASSALLQARRNVQIDEKRGDELSAGRNLGVTGNASATRYDAATKIGIGGGPPVEVVPIHQEALSLVLVQRLDFLGQIRAETNQARLQAQADRVTLDQITNDRVLRAQTIFYNLLRATHQVQVAESALRSSQAQQTTARNLYEGGIGQKIDFLRASTLVAQTEQDVLRAQNDRALARTTFNDLVGRPLTAPVEPVDVPGATVGVDLAPASASATVGTPAPPVSAPFVPPIDEIAAINLDQSILAAQNVRPEVRQSAVLLRVQETGIRLARNGQEPTFAVSLSGNYYPTSSFQFPRKKTAALTASVAIPFYDGGVTRARISEARLRRENAQTTLDSAKSGVALEVREAYLTLSTSVRQITAANAALAQAVAARQLAQVRYEGQVGLFLEVTDAQTTLVRAENAQVDAVYNYLIARAQFENALGTPAILATTPAK